MESDIELLRHAAAMSGDSAALAVAQNQMSRLAGLQHRIEHARGGGLVAIRAEVIASVAASQTLAQQARSTVASAQAAEVALHAASATAHQEVTSFVHDFYERKIFDPYLRFASPEDEAAYRQREEQRLREIEKAMAEGTPEATLRAADLSKAQLLDAGAHGATDSPDFARMNDALDSARIPLARGLDANALGVRAANQALEPTENPLVPADIIATLRATGTLVGDSSETGHGVSVTRTPAPGIALS